MKKRSLKMFVSLIFAMTLVMGMSVSVFAKTYDSGTVDFADFKVGDTLKSGVTITNNSGLYHTRCELCKIATISKNFDTAFAISSAWKSSSHSEHASKLSIGDIPSYLENRLIDGAYTVVDADGNVPAPATPATPASSSHTHNYEWNTLVDPTTEQDGVEAYICSCGDIQTTQPISAAHHILKVNADAVKNAKAGATVVVELGRLNSLPRWFVTKLVERDDLNVTLKITYNHENYTLEVPKTATIEDESIEWYGPLKLMSMFPQK